MGQACPLVVLLLQCRSNLCLHPVNALSLWCFCRESLLLLRFLLVGRMLVVLANTPNQAETPLHSLERAAAGIGLHVDAHKSEFMCFNQKGDISTLDRTSLKLVDKFTYLGSSVSSTEEDIDIRLTKAWTAIDRLSII